MDAMNDETKRAWSGMERYVHGDGMQSDHWDRLIVLCILDLRARLDATDAAARELAEIVRADVRTGGGKDLRLDALLARLAPAAPVAQAPTPQNADVLGRDLRVGDVVIGHLTDHRAIATFAHEYVVGSDSVPWAPNVTYRVRLPRPEPVVPADAKPPPAPAVATEVLGPGLGRGGSLPDVSPVPAKAREIARADGPMLVIGIDDRYELRGPHSAEYAAAQINRAHQVALDAAIAEVRAERDEAHRALDTFGKVLSRETDRTDAAVSRAERAERVVEAARVVRDESRPNCPPSIGAIEQLAITLAALDVARKDTP